MFRLVYINDFNFPHGYYRILGRYSSLKEAREARKVVGDVVVDEEGNIVTDRGWLWDWEREVTEGPNARMGLGDESGPHVNDEGKVAYSLKCIRLQEELDLPYLCLMHDVLLRR